MIITVQQLKPVVLASDPRVIVAGSTGLQGPGVPVGGTTGQALVKVSDDDHDTEWADQTGSGAALSDDAPAALGAAAAGTGDEASRDDHVHAMPSAADVGAAAASHAHVAADVTDLGGAAVLDVGAVAGTVCAGDDSRLSDARTPTAHAHAGEDITSGTIDGDRLPAMSAAKLGGVPATGVASGLFLRDDGTFAAPGGGSADPQSGALAFGLLAYTGGW